MVKRKRIGLIYNYNENWIAGLYYIENIIFSLNTLPDIQKPFLLIYTRNKETFSQLKNITNYSFLKFLPSFSKYSIIERIINKTWRFIFKKNIINKNPKKADYEFLFPNPDSFFDKIDSNKKVYWIPDFQEDHLPTFFPEAEIIWRKNYQSKLAREAKTIVFSSYDAFIDFERLYPKHNAKAVILPFAVQKRLIKIDKELTQLVVKKYDITGDYFLVPNQFWVHKNHKTVLNAVKELVNENQKVQIVFTGKENDYRYPDYPFEIKTMVENLMISKQTKFLGFIPKNDLENLIIGARAIIQPSLFEGWSTVIEEAKLYNKFIIASDIPIHLEQLDKYPNKIYYSKTDPVNLASRIKSLLNSEFKVQEYNYKKDIEIFAKGFLSILHA